MHNQPFAYCFLNSVSDNFEFFLSIELLALFGKRRKELKCYLQLVLDTSLDHPNIEPLHGIDHEAYNLVHYQI